MITKKSKTWKMENRQKNIVILFILCIFLLSIVPTTSAASYSYDWNETTRTATINKHTLLSTNPILDIKQVSVKEGLTTFEEVVEITSYVDYKLTGRDLKWLWTKHRGQHGIRLNELQRLTTESYVVTVQDYGEIEYSQIVSNIISYTNAIDMGMVDLGSVYSKEKWNITYYSVVNETNITGTVGFDRYEVISTNPLKIKFFWNVNEQIGTHEETRYREVFKQFSPFGKTIHNGQTYTIKTILHKKAEVGEFSIHLTPEIAGVTIKELTWWNSSWLYKIESILTDVPSGGYTYNLTVHSASGTNNQTDVFLNGHNATNFADIRFVLDETTELAYWIENETYDPIKVWVNVTDNGTVGLYYSNSDVSSTSNISNTFLFGDDFNNFNNWINQTGTPTITNGILSFCANGLQIYNNVARGPYGIAMREKTKVQGVDFTYSGMLKTPGDWTDECIVTYSRNNGLNFGTWNNSAGAWEAAGGMDSAYHILEMQWLSGNAKLYKDDVLAKERTVNIPDEALNVTLRGLGYWDWVLVRKYVSPEPVWSTWTIQQHFISEVESSFQYNTQRKLTRTSEGYLHRVYTKFDGSNYRVYYGKSMDDGNNWVETVLTDASVNNTHPSIAGDSEDTLWIIYSREGSGIRYRKYEGLSWQTEQTISTDNGGIPVIAVDSSDSIHASWMANLSSTYQIRYWDGTNITNVTSGGNDSKYPSLAIDSNNYLHIAYQKWNSTSSTTNIKYQKYTDSWQSIYNVTLGETYSQQYPCIAVDLSDYVHVTWQTQAHKIMYKRYTTSWQATEDVCDGGIYKQYNPSVSVYATNYVYVTWFGLTAGYPSNYIIREKHWSGGWSGISDILHPAGKNVTYLNTISALYPKICGDCYLNIPLTGFSFVYDEDDGTIKYYNASTWRCPDDYVITITARDSETNQNILNFTVDFSAGETKTTDSGVVKYSCLESGYYEITISSNEYHSAQQSVVLDQSKAIIIYLTPISETVYVLPKAQEVRFFVQDMYGNPKVNVNVTVTTIETTMGSWDWLMDFFGFENATAIQNATMVGSTDSAGSISFLMVETIKYNLHFKNITQDIDINLTIYPKSDRYTVIVGRKPFYYVEPQLFGEEIVWSFNKEIVDSNDAWLNFTYNDTLGETISGSYYVYTVNETTGIEKINLSNRTYYCSTPLYNMSSVWNWSCLVSNYSGKTYILGFNVTHTTAGDFEEAVSATFEHEKTPLIEFEGWTSGYYQFLSIALLIFIGMLFSGTTVTTGAIFLSLSGWILFFIGWFNPTSNSVTSAIILGIVTAVSVGAYITTTGREKNLAS